MKETFGEFLLRLRGDKTRKEVAEKAKISAEYLRQIEYQGKIPREDKLIALADALGRDSKEVLTKALQEKNQEAAQTILSVKPRFPKMRRALLAKLSGFGAEVVKEDLAGLGLAPHERSAILFWGCVFFMDREGLDEQEAREKTAKNMREPAFVEKELVDYVVRHLVSWQVDPETGIQSHYTDEPRIREFLRSVTEHLGHLGGRDQHHPDQEGRAFSELLKEPEFASLYNNLKRYTALTEKEKSEIRAWWELVNRMVEERLADR